MSPGFEFKDKRMAVIGFGIEGRSAAYFLAKNGARVEVFDAKPEEEFLPVTVADLRRLGVIFYFGAMGPLIGFDAVVRSPGISPRVPELAAARKQGISFTSTTKIFFDLCPCSIVGVTGTKGKGTTSSLAYQMLLAAGKDAYLCGNIGTPALDILDQLDKDSVVVYELSSFQLIELEKSPGLAVVLMITSEHLDFHLDTREYLDAKANIVKFQRVGDRAVVNIDYPASRAMGDMTKAEVFGVSRKGKVSRGIYVEDGWIVIAKEDGVRKVMPAEDVSLVGAHNLENICAAAMAAYLLGVPDTAIASAARSFKPLPHRLEFVREVGGVRYYDDSISTTPESSMAALKSFVDPKIMILGGSSKGADWSEFAAALAADRSLKAVIGMGEEWSKIKEAMSKIGKLGREIEMIEGLDSMPEVVREAAKASGAGDVVVLSPGCASFDMFRNYQDRGEQFADEVKKLP